MQKFNRVYELKVEADDQVRPASQVTPGNTKYVTIKLPYTVEFEINRANLSSAQTATFRVYNLGLETRNAIQKDAYQFIFRAVQFRAGYESPDGSFVPLIFNGTVKTAYSYRQGVDFITEIEAYDSAWAISQGYSALSLPPGVTASQAVLQLAQTMPGLVGNPIVGEFNATTGRGSVFFGNTWGLIQQLTNNLAVLDNGQLKALKLNEIFRGGIPVISAETGLLGSPKRTSSFIECEMIFEPRLTLCQIIELQSVTNPQFNRPWKVVGIQHRGMISEAVAGSATSTATLWFTPYEFQEVYGVPVF